MQEFRERKQRERERDLELAVGEDSGAGDSSGAIEKSMAPPVRAYVPPPIATF